MSVPANVERRREGEQIALRLSDARTVYDTWYAHTSNPPSLDVGLGLGVVLGNVYTRREMLETFVRSAGTQVRFRRSHTTQGAPIFMVDCPQSRWHNLRERVAIGIGETWTDAVAQALDMWLSGT